MAKGKSGQHRLQTPISLQAYAYLETLAEGGRHGLNVNDVVRLLLDQGIENAFGRGYLTEEDREKVEGRKR